MFSSGAELAPARGARGSRSPTSGASERPKEPPLRVPLRQRHPPLPPSLSRRAPTPGPGLRASGDCSAWTSRGHSTPAGGNEAPRPPCVPPCAIAPLARVRGDRRQGAVVPKPVADLKPFALALEFAASPRKAPPTAFPSPQTEARRRELRLAENPRSAPGRLAPEASQPETRGVASTPRPVPGPSIPLLLSLRRIWKCFFQNWHLWGSAVGLRRWRDHKERCEAAGVGGGGDTSGCTPPLSKL